jgi:hypothetical protein
MGVPPAPIRTGILRHVVTIVVALLVVGGIGYIGVVRPMMEDRLWVEGACIDYYPADSVEHGIKAAVVGCSDDRARARIVGVVDRDATLEDCEPMGAFALVDRRNATYCIVELAS